MYKVGQFIKDKRVPSRIFEILAVDSKTQEAYIKNINTSNKGVWNSFKALQRHTSIYKAYNTPLYKALNQ